jgi:predicted ferric reductase
MINGTQDIETITPAASLQGFLLGCAAIMVGTLLAAVALPNWLPGLSASLLGSSPKVFWFLSRASALVGFALLWASMAMGLILSNRMARLWPGGPTALGLHQYVSLLGLEFGLFHALILLGDRFIQASLAQVLTPFAYQNYRPGWVGLGQIGLYLWALVFGSFYVRKRIGTKAWRWIHSLSFLSFVMVLAHGLFSGTDSGAVWVIGLYGFAGISCLFLLYYRILATVGGHKARQTTR